MKRIIGIPFSKKKSSDKDGGKQEPVAPAPGAAPSSSAGGAPAGVDQPQLLPPQLVAWTKDKEGQDSVPPTSPLPVKDKEPGWLTRIGLRKKTQPLADLLPELVSKNDAKVEQLEKKIAQCEAELKPISIRLKKVAEGSTKNNLKAKAQGIIQRKKRYEEQVETLRQQSFNIDQTNGTLESTKEAAHVAAAMKQGVKELKKEQRKIPLDSLDALHDEMGELFDNSADVQDVLASGFTVPEGIDDKELEDQLNLLGDEIAADNDTTYLDEALSQNNKNGVSNKNQTKLLPAPEVDVGAFLAQPPASQDLNDIVFDAPNSKA